MNEQRFIIPLIIILAAALLVSLLINFSVGGGGTPFSRTVASELKDFVGQNVRADLDSRYSFSGLECTLKDVTSDCAVFEMGTGVNTNPKIYIPLNSISRLITMQRQGKTVLADLKFASGEFEGAPPTGH